MCLEQTVLKIESNYTTFYPVVINDKLLWVQYGRMYVYDLKQNKLQVVKHNDVEFWLVNPLPLVSLVNKLEQILQVKIDGFKELKFGEHSLSKVVFTLAQPVKICPAKGYILSEFDTSQLWIRIYPQHSRQYIVLSDYTYNHNFAIIQFSYFVPRIIKPLYADDKIRYRVISAISSDFYRRILPMIEYRTQFEGKAATIRFFFDSEHHLSPINAKILV